MGNPDHQRINTEPTATAPAAAKPKPVRYVFTCGDGPCRLNYEFENPPQQTEQRKLLPANLVVYSPAARMKPEAKPFRFLTDREFLELPVNDRAAYLARAAQELEIRQEEFRRQRSKLDAPNPKLT